MALNIVLVLAFQTIFGYIYTWIGLTLACFMAGLVTGSWLVDGKMDRFSLRGLLAVILAGQLVMCALLIPVLRALSSFPSLPLFFLLVLLSGGLVGGVFPIVNVLYTEGLGRRRVGSLYAADILGGSFGSLALSGFLIPVFGFQHTLLLALSLVAGAVIFLAVHSLRS
jgi:spermidine synthase